MHSSGWAVEERPCQGSRQFDLIRTEMFEASASRKNTCRCTRRCLYSPQSYQHITGVLACTAIFVWILSFSASTYVSVNMKKNYMFFWSMYSPDNMMFTSRSSVIPRGISDAILNDVFWSMKTHDDVIKWKYFPRYWPFAWEIYRSLVNPPHKGQWRGAFMFSLICAWTNDWATERDAGHLRRHRAHYDVTIWCS